ncbi:hypothetical protein [Tenuifilum sp.]|uniref:hypothetical protein n=1 Tax=Tenuifilum sp. TaxID=2760880 RepID=UPI0025880DA2|nr:hypothetical protein [Tenuifilum sp.]
MKYFLNRNCLICLVMFMVWGCTKNIEPVPNSANLSPSLSFPIGEGEFNLSKSLVTLGIPVVNLTENVPGWAKYADVYIQDTFTLNIDEVFDQSDNIELIMFKVNIWNEFPLAGEAQVWFVDDTYNKIDSLFTTEKATVPAAEIYSNGTVVGTKFESYKSTWDKERVELLRSATNVIVRAGLKVTEEGVTEQNIQYFDDYALRVQLAARVDFSLNLNN